MSTYGSTGCTTGFTAGRELRAARPDRFGPTPAQMLLVQELPVE